MSSRGPPKSSRTPASTSSSMAPALARIWSVLFSARCTAKETSPISSEMPPRAAPIRTWAWAAEYWALMISFLLRKASTLAWSRCSAAVSFSCSSSIPAICSSKPWSSMRAFCLRWRARRAKSSRPASRACLACRSRRAMFSWTLAACCWMRRLAVTISTTPRLTFCSISSCFS